VIPSFFQLAAIRFFPGSALLSFFWPHPQFIFLSSIHIEALSIPPSFFCLSSFAPLFSNTLTWRFGTKPLEPSLSIFVDCFLPLSSLFKLTSNRTQVIALFNYTFSLNSFFWPHHLLILFPILISARFEPYTVTIPPFTPALTISVSYFLPSLLWPHNYVKSRAGYKKFFFPVSRQTSLHHSACCG